MLGTQLPLLHKNLHDPMMDILQNALPNCDNIAFTADKWAGPGNPAYLALTIHYVSKNFVLRKFTVYCQVTEGVKTNAQASDLICSMIDKISGLSEDTSICMVNNGNKGKSVQENKALD